MIGGLVKVEGKPTKPITFSVFEAFSFLLDDGWHWLANKQKPVLQHNILLNEQEKVNFQIFCMFDIKIAKKYRQINCFSIAKLPNFIFNQEQT